MSQEELFDSLYTSKLHDSGNEYTEKDYTKFINQLNASFPKGTIDFSCQQIGMGVLTRLTKVLRTAPHIRKFNFYGNIITDHGLHSLFQLLLINPHVTIVDIGCNNISNQGVPILEDIITKTNIKSLQLGISGAIWHRNNFTTQAMSDIFDALLESPHIECLGLSGIQMSVRQGARRISIAEKFADFLVKYEPLRTISLSDCGFTRDDEEYVFIKGLINNPRLVYIECSKNCLGDPIGSTFCNNIHNITALRRINLSRCNLSGESGLALANSLKTSKLISLDISHNNIDTRGMNAILDVLKDNIYLTEFSASFNNFDKGISEKLHDVVKVNRVLAYLDISHNKIFDNCAFAIADNLESNDSLVSLNLATCKLTGEGSIALANSIVRNTSLTSINLSDNFLTSDEGYELIRIFKDNEILRNIDLSSTQIDHFVIQESYDICNRNKHIQYEQDLQPLKKEMIQLSIQRTKMPEAKARLASLYQQYQETAEKIKQTTDEYNNFNHKANNTIEELRMQINGVKAEIEKNKTEIENMTTNGEKVEADAVSLYDNTTVKIECVEKQITQYETQASNIEEKTRENNKKFEEEKAKLLQAIEEEKKKARETRSIIKDEEKLMEYEPPEGMYEEPLFLIDQVSSIDDKKTSRSRASKASKASKLSKNSKPKRSKSPGKAKREKSPKGGKGKSPKSSRSKSPKSSKDEESKEGRPDAPTKGQRD